MVVYLCSKKDRKPIQPNKLKLSILEKMWLIKGPLKLDPKGSYVLQDEILNAFQRLIYWKVGLLSRLEVWGHSENASSEHLGVPLLCLVFPLNILCHYTPCQAVLCHDKPPAIEPINYRRKGLQTENPNQTSLHKSTISSILLWYRKMTNCSQSSLSSC